MSWIDIENNESGSSVRAKINTAFAYLYNQIIISATPLWEVIGGNNRVTPTSDRDVEVPTLHANAVETTTLSAGTNNQVQVVGNQLRCTYLGGFPQLTKPLVVDNEGFVITGDETGQGDAPVGRGVRYITFGEGTDVDLMRPTMLININANYDIQFPEASLYNNAEVVVRKMGDNAYAVTLNTILDQFRHDHQVGNGITTIDPGAWVRVKAVMVSEVLHQWMVVEMGGTWTIITE